jgi:hypothetical protein
MEDDHRFLTILLWAVLVLAFLLGGAIGMLITRYLI